MVVKIEQNMIMGDLMFNLFSGSQYKIRLDIIYVYS